MLMRFPKNLHFALLALPLLLLGTTFRPPAPNPVPAKDEPCEMENNTFLAGEEIVYKLYYNWNFVWLSAGEVVFRVKDLGSQYHITATGRTYPSYEWFYKVRDNYESYIDKKTLLPTMHIKDIQEGGYSRYDRTVFKQQERKAISLRGKDKASAEEKIIPLDGCMHDLISIVYYCRNLNFNQFRPGQKMPIKIFMDREIYPLKVKYLGKEENLKVKGMGRYNTHSFSPQLIAGEVFKEGDEMTVWVSDDRNRIPVLIESPVSVGSVKVVLKSYKGLKYDFTAKVK